MKPKKKAEVKNPAPPQKPSHLRDLSVKNDSPKGGYIGETEKNLKRP